MFLNINPPIPKEFNLMLSSRNHKRILIIKVCANGHVFHKLVKSNKLTLDIAPSRTTSFFKFQNCCHGFIF